MLAFMLPPPLLGRHKRWRFADADFGNAMRVNMLMSRMTTLHLPLVQTLHPGKKRQRCGCRSGEHEHT
jgi:hypothetical protein